MGILDSLWSKGRAIAPDLLISFQALFHGISELLRQMTVSFLSCFCPGFSRRGRTCWYIKGQLVDLAFFRSCSTSLVLVSHVDSLLAY